MQEFNTKVSGEYAGRRLDIFLLDFFKQNNLAFSRTFVQKLIRQGNIRLKQRVKLKPHYKLKENDEINILFEVKREMILKAEDIPLRIIYEDDDLAVINKPQGLVVHPAPGNYEHTLVNGLLYHFKDLSDINPKRPGIVHRLDKETSGLMVVAKNNVSHLNLISQFAKHTVKRTYIAVVKGMMEFDENIIELPIGRHPAKRKKMSVGFSEKTKPAKTYYKTLKRAEDFSLVELKPFTGRTHQLRVHLAFINHPILGDDKYGNGGKSQRLMLHAKTIGFIHPRTQKYIEFSTEIPKEFLKIFNAK
ncbi:MAG: RluA family pseudouridine synthase [Candidatus Omnitrophica bacterium]|nr:RluA family pseudouridine synthase [Candidatus Omnitrophota bacterium]